MTVDGTDFPIYEPTPYSRKWYSHKFKGPGLRYEIAMSIQSGDIVWCNGPYPAGWSDLKIARDALVFQLEPGEMVCADGGYRDGGEFFQTPTGEKNVFQKCSN